MITDYVTETHKLLKTSDLTLSCAESLTSGLLQFFSSKESGSSKYFMGGVTAYSISVKASLLGVDEQQAIACNAVSHEVVTSMAIGCAKLFNTDLALATTGYAEPYTDENGTSYPQEVFVGLSALGSVTYRRLDASVLKGLQRGEVQHLAASTAFEMLFEYLRDSNRAKS